MRELAEAINHHLRTPLAAILGHAELLLDRRHELPSPLEGSAAGIVRAGARAPRVVLEGRPGLVCAADRGRLGRAVRTLLDHVTAYAPEDSEVHVAADATTDTVRISLRSTVRGAAEAGAGVHAASVPEASSDDGLALTLASAIAEAHGGCLVFVEGPRGGVEARLDLPAHR